MGNTPTPDISPGEFYEDCRYHSMLCLEVDADNDEGGDTVLIGISLITGDVGSCSLQHCGVVKLTLQEAITRKALWPQWSAAYDEVRSLYEQRFPGRSAEGA